MCGLLMAGLAHGALLEGASLLQDPLAEGLSLSPVHIVGSGSAWRLGLQGNAQVRNDYLRLRSWNTYAGQDLDNGDKHGLMAELGPELAVSAHARMSLFDAAMDIPNRPGWRAGVLLENVADGAGRLDLSLLETVLFGNDPEDALVVKQAGFSGEVLTRLRLALSGPGHYPEFWPAGWGELPLRWGLDFFVERGEAMTRTRAFSGRVEPLMGAVEAHFSHVQEVAGIGFGWGLDAGVELETSLREKPLRLGMALRGLPHLRTWRDRRITERSFDLPRTPVGTSFDFDAFNMDVNDTSITRRSSAVTEFLNPGWILSADWSASRAWRHSLLAEQAPEDATGSGRRQLSWYSRWRPGGGSWFLGGELAGGMGRGPVLGTDLGFQSAGYELSLGAKGFAGLGNSTRGLQLGISCRWMIH